MHRIVAGLFVIYIVILSFKSAFAVDFSDPRYRNCISARSIFYTLGNSSYPLNLNSSFEINGRFIKLSDLKRRDLAEDEEHIQICNDIESTKLPPSVIHARMEGVWQRIRDAQIQPIRNELRTFEGRILLPAELNRLNQIRDQYPELVNSVDRIVGVQAGLKAEAAQNEQQERERAENDRKIMFQKAEADRRVTQEREANAEREAAEAQAAEAAEAAKTAAFAASIPQACRDAEKIERQLQSDDFKAKVNRAIELAAAGETESACEVLLKMSKGMEDARSRYVACSKALESNPDPRASTLSQDALNAAVRIYSSQVGINDSLSKMGCQ